MGRKLADFSPAQQAAWRAYRRHDACSVEELKLVLSIYISCAMSGQCEEEDKHQRSIDRVMKMIEEKRKGEPR